MGRKNYWFFVVIIFAILGIFICTNIPFQLGLDLRGGSQLTLEIQPTQEITKITTNEIEGVKAVLDKRVNGLGVSDSQLQTIGTNQLLLELPGEQDPSGAAKVLGETALLEFRIQKNGTEAQLRDLQSQRNNIESIIKLLEENNNSAQLIKEININNEINKLFEKYKIQTDKILEVVDFNLLKNKISKEIAGLFEPTALTGQYLTNAGRRQDQNTNKWEVTLTFNNEGGELFADLAKSIAGSSRLIGIVIDGISYSEASVGRQFETAGITGGAATISGNFTADDARNLEVQLRGGALPLPIDIIQIRTIGPSLGTQNIRLSLFAALSGLFFVGVFMEIRTVPAGHAGIFHNLYWGGDVTGDDIILGQHQLRRDVTLHRGFIFVRHINSWRTFHRIHIVPHHQRAATNNNGRGNQKFIQRSHLYDTFFLNSFICSISTRAPKRVKASFKLPSFTLAQRAAARTLAPSSGTMVFSVRVLAEMFNALFTNFKRLTAL